MRRTTFGVLFTVVVAVAMAQTPPAFTVSGFLTDTLCGKRGANHLHVEHAKNSVASDKAK